MRPGHADDPVQQISLRAHGHRVSALYAATTGAPRGLVLALHGGGMTSGYFDCAAEPVHSLLRLAPRVGFAVLAPDRPGYGASAAWLPQGTDLAGQAELLYETLDDFARTHDVGAGVYLLAHSFGLMVALQMAAGRRGDQFLGLDGSGTIWRYAAGREPHRFVTPGRDDPPKSRALFWGSQTLYPTGTFERGDRLPTAEVPLAEEADAQAWPDLLPGLAPQIRVPYQLGIAEFEPWWRADPAHLSAYADLFTAAPELRLHTIARAPHNVSLSLGARAYHLQALAHAEHCLALAG